MMSWFYFSRANWLDVWFRTTQFDEEITQIPLLLVIGTFV